MFNFTKTMRKHILVISLLASLVAPSIAFAVNDVVIQNNINVGIESPGTTLIINPVTVDQIVVNTTNVVITMSANGSAVTITSADKYTFIVSGIDNHSTNCGVLVSTLVLPAQTTAVAVTVTPSALCSGSTVPAALPLNLAPAPAPTEESKEELPTTTTEGAAAVTTTEGGEATATTDDGTTAKVNIPPAAIFQNATVTISPIEKTSAIVAAAPAGKNIVGNNVFNYNIKAAGVAITTFAADLTLTFTYTAAQIANLKESSLEIRYFNETSKLWIPVQTTVDIKTKTLTVKINHLTLFAIFAATGTGLDEGSLIRGPDGIKVYIVNDFGYKRHIFNPVVFDMYSHFSWGSVIEVSQATLDSHATSDLYRADGDQKVYLLEEVDGTATKRHIEMTAEQFLLKGYDWNQVFIVNAEERDYYSLGLPITF